MAELREFQCAELQVNLKDFAREKSKGGCFFFFYTREVAKEPYTLYSIMTLNVHRV